MTHPLDPVIQAFSGFPLTDYEGFETSRKMHISGMLKLVKKTLPGMEVTPKAVEKWFELGRLPNKWRILFTWLAEHNNISITLPEPDIIKEPTA